MFSCTDRPKNNEPNVLDHISMKSKIQCQNQCNHCCPLHRMPIAKYPQPNVFMIKWLKDQTSINQKSVQPTERPCNKMSKHGFQYFTRTDFIPFATIKIRPNYFNVLQISNLSIYSGRLAWLIEAVRRFDNIQGFSRPVLKVRNLDSYHWIYL